MKTRVYIKTYGCTLNQADSNAMEAILHSRGYSIVDNEEEADVIILNSCAVKDATEKKQLFRIQNYYKENKPLVVAGCLTYNKDLIRKVNPNTVVVSTGAIEEIEKAVIDAINNNPNDYIKFKPKRREFLVKDGIARIALQDGCTENCSYCATKLARPLLTSEPPRKVYEMIKEAKQRRAFEIQLAGMDTGAYGLDLGTNLYELLNGIAEMFEGENFRIRVGMLNMVHINRIGYKLIEAFKPSVFYKFFHLPVQSGSQRILDLMNRRHSLEDFYNAVKKVRELFPLSSISTDIIVGFPTEEDEDFEATLKLLKDLELDVVNISKFSPRPLTKAYSMQYVKPEKVKERSRIITEVVNEICKRVNKRYVGKEFDVLITEKGQEEKQVKGRTEFYKQVVIDEKIELGEWVRVKIKDSSHTSLFGEVVV